MPQGRYTFPTFRPKGASRPIIYKNNNLAGVMTLKAKILLLAIVPLVVATVAITSVSLNQARNLGEQEIQTFRANLIKAREDALVQQVTLAQRAIANVRGQTNLTTQQQQTQIRQLVHELRYGSDGYFFVYDQQGINLVHPILDHLVGQNLLDLQDADGQFIIRNLLAASAQGGGFHQYLWSKPSTGKTVDKLSYVERVPDWNWMIGTGLYIDDIAEETAKIRQEVDSNIRQTFVSVVIILTLSIIIIIAVGIIINIREHRLADENLKVLAHKTVQFQEQEKRRVSRELHDGINQLLVSVKYRLESLAQRLNDSVSQQQLEESETVLTDAIQEVRRISHDLRPAVLDDLGLIVALNSLAKEFSQRTGIYLNCIFEPDLDNNLNDDVSTTLYRLVQESLTNIERHAEAKQVEIRIQTDAEGLYLIIKDDGRGFLHKHFNKSQGIGLRNMRERVEFLEGEFSVDSELGQGTTIEAHFPTLALKQVS